MYKINLLKRITRDLMLFIQKPRDYIYSFRLSNDIFVQMYPFDPKVQKQGRRLAAMIQKKFPETKVHFFGSAALGIDGRNDIDLMIDCDGARIGEYLPYLCSVFGVPIRQKPLEVKWSSVKHGVVIDVMLVDVNHVVRNTLLSTYSALSKNSHLVGEYDRLKKESIGTSLREYQRRRMAFFNSIDRAQFLHNVILAFRSLVTWSRPTSNTAPESP